MIKGMEDEKKIISDDWIGRSQSIVEGKIRVPGFWVKKGMIYSQDFTQILHYTVVDFTLYRYTVDALVMQGVRGESSKPLKKCAASRIKNESEMKNVCKAKKEKSWTVH